MTPSTQMCAVVNTQDSLRKQVSFERKVFAIFLFLFLYTKPAKWGWI